jgi:tetratricopeptide (TPR) repeat protein
LLLIITTISAWTPAHAYLDEQAASLQADQGRAALARGQYLDADRLLTGALEAGSLPFPIRAFVLSDRGIARWRLSRPYDAIDDFNAALRLAPEEAALYNNRGNVLLGLDYQAEAAKDFGQAIALAPSYGAAYNNRGNARFLLGDYAASFADFTKAMTLMPESAVPFNGRGKAQLALKRPAGAIRDFSRAITLSARYGQAYANRAEAMIALRRYQDAISDYSSAIQFGADTPQIYLARGSVYARLHKRGLALADFSRATERDPSLVAVIAERRLVEGTAVQQSELAEAEPRAPVSASGPPTPGPLACADRQASAEGEARLQLSSLADASENGVPNFLLHQTKGELADPVGTVEPAPADYRTASPCDPNGQQDAGPLAGTPPAEPDGERSAGMEADDWRLDLTSEGDFLATHPLYPAVHLTLEMYGSGQPELLHWQTLHGRLRGIGLLHYYAGSSAEGERLEYVAMINTRSGRLIAIEPGRWGDRQAKWTWDDLAVVVVDPHGVPSRVQVREDDQRSDHLRRIKRIGRHIPPQQLVSRRARTPMWSSGRFNPWNFR